MCLVWDGWVGWVGFDLGDRSDAFRAIDLCILRPLLGLYWLLPLSPISSHCAATGHYVGKTMKITELPQMVAAFHSLVGLAAVVTSIANVMAADPGHLDMTHKVGEGRKAGGQKGPRQIDG